MTPNKETIEAAAKEYAGARLPNANATDAPFVTTGDLYDLVKDVFKNACEWLASQSQWVDVRERLPEDGQIVLSFGDGVQPSMSVYKQGMFNRYVDQIPGDRISLIYYSEVTHWMPLPENPPAAL